MKAITHKISHTYQPTDNTCGYTALSMLLSFYKKKISVEDLVKNVPQPVDEKGKVFGSITAQLVAWCAQNSMKTKMWTSDTQITDLSWAGLDRDALLERLRKVQDIRDVSAIGGKFWSKEYIKAYITMLEAGAELEVVPFIGLKLLNERLKLAPVFANVSQNILNKNGRSRDADVKTYTSTPDDASGRTYTHSVVIYGLDEQGNFLVADPWDGLRKIEPEHMVLSIAGAQIECDNQIFQILT